MVRLSNKNNVFPIVVVWLLIIIVFLSVYTTNINYKELLYKQSILIYNPNIIQCQNILLMTHARSLPIV